jgi:hypothetical protein
MTEPTNHTVTNRYGNTIIAPVVYAKDLGGGRAEVHIETNYHIEEGYDHPAVYTVRGNQAQGRYVATAREFSARQSYIYQGEFTRQRRGG